MPIEQRRPTNAENIALRTGAIPSMLQTPSDRDDIGLRLGLIKNLAEQHKIYAPKELSDDVHFWGAALNEYVQVAKTTRSTMNGLDVPKERIQQLAIKTAMRHAENIVDKERPSLKDALTGAWSRRAIDRYAQHLIYRQSQLEGQTAILFVDIDNFKDYNNKGGHDLGDKVLKGVVGVLEQHTRAYDMVGRYGGDELTVILPDMKNPENPGKKAQTLAEHIQNQLDITVSIGVATISPDDETPDSLYKRSDDCVYRAKDFGKNRAVTSRRENGQLIYTDFSTGFDYKITRILGRNGYKRLRK